MQIIEKYGFIHIWFDKKRKMFYIGCHWGTEDDGYICSSNRMRKAYKRRPKDFKRRIISKIYTNRNDLLNEEFRWLSLISDEKLGKKYYNLRKHHFGHWLADENNSDNIKQKISNTLKELYSDPTKNPFYGKKHTNETKQKIKKARAKQTFSDETKQKLKEARANQIMTPEHRRKIGESQKDLVWYTNGTINKRLRANDEIPEGFYRGSTQKRKSKI